MSKRQKGISIIIPAYNVEKYLKECLESFVNQKNMNNNLFEVIIVNDGSTDKTGEIAQTYVEKYPYIFKLYNKKNGGLSDARNFGISKSKMEYITFVDSDDWVTDDYVYTLSKYINSNYDVVMFDAIAINDGWKQGTVIEVFKKERQTIYNFILESTNPAFAPARMFHYKILDICQFPNPDIWYEDVATIPILLSFAKQIKYIKKPLYYYRQRPESITSKSQSERNLEIIKGWERVLKSSNKEYIKEIEYAIYFSINTFIKFRPKFAEKYVEFAKQYQKQFETNKYINESIKNKIVENIFKLKFIPKKIHFFWFGNNPKSDLINKCIDSWKKYASDYEIIEWNEKTCDINECQYVKEAYEAKKWAFVADYFRTKIIYEHGGIYLDTDMELTNYIDELRLNQAFFQFETVNVGAGIFGAIPNHPIIKEWYESYLDDKFIMEDGSINTSNTIVVRLTKILEKKYKLIYNCENHEFPEDKIKIYAPDYLMIDVYNGNNMAIHHYDASWWDSKIGIRSYKYDVLEYFFSQKLNTQMNNKESKILKKIVKILKLILPNRIYLLIRKFYRKITNKH